MAYVMGLHQMYGSGGQVAAEVGYGLAGGQARFVGLAARVGLTTSEYGRDYRVGYGLGVLDRGKLNFELGVDAATAGDADAGRSQQRTHGPGHARLVGAAAQPAAAGRRTGGMEVARERWATRCTSAPAAALRLPDPHQAQRPLQATATGKRLLGARGVGTSRFRRVLFILVQITIRSISSTVTVSAVRS